MSLTLPLGKLLDEQAMNAAAASRTVIIDTGELMSVGFGMNSTFVGGTALAATFYRSYDGGTTWHGVPVVSLSDTAIAPNDASLLTASTSTSYSVPCEDATNVKAVFSFVGSPGATDLLTVVCGGRLR